MDLERIKQNFRIRSGRARQQKRKAKQVYDSPQTPNGNLKTPTSAVKDSPIPKTSDLDSTCTSVQTTSLPPALATQFSGAQASGASEASQQDTENGVEQRPGLQHATTDIPNRNFKRSTMTRRDTEPALATDSPSSESEDFDLNPPKPRSRPPALETLASWLWSAGHLNTILHNPTHLARFAIFLQRYIPQTHPLLSQYLETQKAIKAVEYANAIAEALRPKEMGEDTSLEIRKQAATLDEEFKRISDASFRALVGEALPTYISYSLVKVVSECLTNEITGRSTPIMRDLVGGLSEVFCLTDPKQDDNPIIYASEEFYRLTRYGPEDTLNANCRFLQGRKTNPDSPRRLKVAVVEGKEITETLLNYRRDGKPFINLLMIAPLHDRHGKLKYFLGAQVDVTGLVEAGRALPSFQHHLNRKAEIRRWEDRDQARRGFNAEQRRKNRALEKLRDLSEMFDLEESSVVQANSRATSLTREDDDVRSVGSADRMQRRVYADSDPSEADLDEESDADGLDLDLGQSGHGKASGKLPGVYDSFLLLRPAPSLRIVFSSPRLRLLGNILQTPFLSHVAAPGGTLSGLAESLHTGVPVSAKIHFMPERGENRNGTKLRNGTKHEDGKYGKAVWVSMTPLIGEDDRIGVWMCVVVEKSRIGPFRNLKYLQPQQERQELPVKRQQNRKTNEVTSVTEDDTPIKPIRVNSSNFVDKVATKDLEDDNPSKSVRQMESIYFDAEGGHDNTNDEQDSNAVQAASPTPPRQDLPEDPPTQPPSMPLEALLHTRKHSKFSAPVPSYEPFETPVDEYITTRSPQMPPQHEHSRVIIEEDSDVLARDQDDVDEDGIVNIQHEPVGEVDGKPRPEPRIDCKSDDGSEHYRTATTDTTMDPQRETATERDPNLSEDVDRLGLDETNEHTERKEYFVIEKPENFQQPAHSEVNDDYQSETGSAASELAPSIPSSALLPDEEDGPDFSHHSDTPSHLPQPRVAEAAKHRKGDINIDNEDHITYNSDEGKNAADEVKESEDKDDHIDVFEDCHNRDERSPDTLRGQSSDALEPTAILHPRVSSQNGYLDDDRDRDSAIAMASPVVRRKPSVSPAVSNSPVVSEPAAELAESTNQEREEAEHELDIENWVAEGRPAPAHQHLRMDYLRSGSQRLSRRPTLGKDAIDTANLGHGNDDDNITSADWCARSPYSVD